MTDAQIAGRFNAAVGRHHRTLLLGGASEPLYLPAHGRSPAIIRYTRDYPHSALHEIAHWCLAGSKRRLLPDYGYWYVPPPRSAAEQVAFFAAEERVQALESIMAGVCGLKFQVSTDQLGDVDESVGMFAHKVAQRAAHMRCRGLRGRAGEVVRALAGPL